MFAKVDTKKNQFLDKAKAARAERAQEVTRAQAAVKIQVSIISFNSVSVVWLTKVIPYEKVIHRLWS